MSRILKRLLGSKIAIDTGKLEKVAALSFKNSQYDDLIQRLYFASQHSTEVQNFFYQYQQKSTLLEESSYIPINEELELLRLYIRLNELLQAEHFYIQYQENVEPSSIYVPPLILFPLIQNAIQNGYNNMEKYPIKIRLKVYAHVVHVEVSNRVNHHLPNQEITGLIDDHKSRLDFHFKDRHSLLFNSNSNTFKASLHLPF